MSNHPKVDFNVLLKANARSVNRAKIEQVALRVQPHLWEAAKDAHDLVKQEALSGEAVALALMQCVVGVGKINGASKKDLLGFLDAAWASVKIGDAADVAEAAAHPPEPTEPPPSGNA